MTDMELAEEIERDEMVILALTVPCEIKAQIIAALRRGPELERALKNEAAFHCLLHHCQRALSMPGPHTFDKELSDGVHAAIEISHGERAPMKLHFSNDWLRKAIASDPDMDIEAGPDIAERPPSGEMVKTITYAISLLEVEGNYDKCLQYLHAVEDKLSAAEASKEAK